MSADEGMVEEVREEVGEAGVKFRLMFEVEASFVEASMAILTSANIMIGMKLLPALLRVDKDIER